MSSKSFLVIVSLVLGVILGFFLRRAGEGSSQSGPSADKDHIVIGLSMDTLKEARWERARDVIVERAKELGAEVHVLSANSDDSRQVADVTTLIASGVDVLIIVPHDGKAMAKGVELARAAKIPTIAYDRLITNSDLDLYVTFDNRKVGQLQAQFILNELKDAPKPIKIVRILGSKTDTDSFLFKAGQDDVLNPAISSGQVRILHEDWAQDWKSEPAKRITNAAIATYGNQIQAILATNDNTAGGAIEAMKEAGLARNVVITGQNAELVAAQRIVSDEQSMTIYKPVQQLAKRTAEVAVALAKGEPVIAKGETPNGKRDVPSILHDVITVTKHNIDATIIADGFQTREAVYGN